MYNIDIRSMLKSNRIYGYEIAAALGIAETSFSRMMARGELPSETKERIRAAIKKLKEANSMK